jgi:osmotically-inducible protein OsmY
MRGRRATAPSSAWANIAARGRKAYQRSDDRTKELLCERLREDPHIDPSEVTITVQGGKITLEGTVDSRQTKNAIEDIAEQFGTQDVQNNLRVQTTGPADRRAGAAVKERTGTTRAGRRKSKHN